MAGSQVLGGLPTSTHGAPWEKERHSIPATKQLEPLELERQAIRTEKKHKRSHCQPAAPNRLDEFQPRWIALLI